MEQPLLNLEPSADKKKLIENALSLYTNGVIPVHTFKLIEKRILEKFEAVTNPRSKQIETFDARKDEFRKTLFAFTKWEKNPTGLYEKAMMKDFFDYWSEANKSRSKMRYENERTWELTLRLANWDRMAANKQFKPTGINSYPTHYDRKFEAKLSTIECQGYWKILRENGWVPVKSYDGSVVNWKKA